MGNPALLSLVACAYCLCALIPSALAQFGQFSQYAPYAALMGGSSGQSQNSVGDGISGYLAFLQLERRLNALESNVRSGAIGGCESGVLGPLTPAQPTGVIQYQGQFIAPPTISLSVSDIKQTDPNAIMNIQIRPIQMSATQATVTLIDVNKNVAQVYVSYMACPSNSNAPVGNSMSYLDPVTGQQTGANVGSFDYMMQNPFLLNMLFGSGMSS